MLRPLTVATESARRTWHPESLNQWTHALAFVLSIVAAIVMLSVVGTSGDPPRILGCIVYLVLQTCLYAASTLSHSFDEGPRRDFYRMLDQVCIFLMMVGSYTPFALVHLSHDGWWLLLVAMWVLATVGIINRIRGGNRTTSTIAFMLLGWLPLIAIPQMYAAVNGSGLALILAGGLAYTVGTWFLANDIRRPYFHAVWHLSTIAGSTIHFFFLLEYVARSATVA
jgi:hemolysin III